MPFRFKKTPEYAGQSAKLINLGLGGRLGTPGISTGGGGGGGTGTALDPYVLLTDGTPLLFTIDSSVNAEYQSDSFGGTYYGKYVTFVCPVLAPGDSLRIRYGIQTDFVDYLDTYMYVFDGATYTFGVNTYVDEDDDNGAGYYDEFENTLLEFPDGTLTEGNSYIIEATTYNDLDVGNVKIIADVLSGPTQIYINSANISNGASVTASSEAAIALNLTTTGVNTTYSVVDSLSSPVSSGNMPFDLRALTDGDTYTVTAGGAITFTLTMSALPDISGITNKVLHLDASDVSTLTLSGFNVTSWADKSVAGNDATPILEPAPEAPEGFYPTYSPSNVAVEFLAARLTGMATNAFLGVAPEAAKTIFFVGSDLAETTPECFWSYGAAQGQVLSRYLSSTAPVLLIPGFGGLNFYDASMPTRAEPPVFNVYRNTPGTNPQTVRMYDESGYGELTSVTLFNTPSTYGLHLMRPIPSATINAGIHQSGNVHEVLAYNTDLSDLNVASIINYIKLKWGILSIV